MPILTESDKRYLFVHIPKTSGSSVQALFEGCGWEVYRKQDGEQHATRNEWKEWGDFDLVFTIVRHPLTRFVSDMRGRGVEPEEMNDLVLKWLREPYERHGNHTRPQLDFFKPGDGVAFRYEDLHYRRKLLKLTKDGTFPHIKGDTYNTEVKESVLTNENIQRIQNHYKEDMWAFGYPWKRAEDYNEDSVYNNGRS